MAINENDLPLSHHHFEDSYSDAANQSLEGEGHGRRDTAIPVARSTFRAPTSWRPVQRGELLSRRYRVEELLGRTDDEIVVIARHVELGQRVVVRILSADAMDSPEKVAAFQRTARKAFTLRSRYAERLLDTGRLENGCLYRAAEFPSVPTLSDVLKVRGPLPMTEAVDLISMACEAVAEAHAHGLVYRNLGTVSLLVERCPDGSPLVRVVDLGALDAITPEALRSHDLTVIEHNSLTRCLPYYAPEQIRNPEEVDARADVWSLGAILYELLAGRRVFDAETSIALLAKIAADSPEPLSTRRPDLPRALCDIVHSCLQKSPAQRPSSADAVMLSLTPFASTRIHAMASGYSSLPPATSYASHPTPPWYPDARSERVPHWAASARPGPVEPSAHGDGRAMAEARPNSYAPLDSSAFESHAPPDSNTPAESRFSDAARPATLPSPSAIHLPHSAVAGPTASGVAATAPAATGSSVASSSMAPIMASVPRDDRSRFGLLAAGGLIGVAAAGLTALILRHSEPVTSTAFQSPAAAHGAAALTADPRLYVVAPGETAPAAKPQVESAPTVESAPPAPATAAPAPPTASQPEQAPPKPQPAAVAASEPRAPRSVSDSAKPSHTWGTPASTSKRAPQPTRQATNSESNQPQQSTVESQRESAEELFAGID